MRVEAVRGVWTLRDDANILFNFGANKGDAEQAAAVVQRYGFNRVGVVGAPNPVMTYLFAAPDAGPQLPQQQGPLAKVRDGDIVRVDAVAGTLQVHVPAEEWNTRENATTDLTPSHFGMGRELFAVFRNAAAPAVAIR